MDEGQQQEEQQPEQKGGSLTWIILFSIVILVIVVIGILWMKSKGTKTTTTPPSSQQTGATTGNCSRPTYTNPEVGYSIQVPANWNINCQLPTTVVIFSATVEEFNQNPLPKQSGKVEIRITDLNPPLEGYFKTVTGKDPTDADKANIPGADKAYRTGDDYFIQEGAKLVTVAPFIAPDAPESIDEELDQIVSTLTFK